MKIIITLINVLFKKIGYGTTLCCSRIQVTLFGDVQVAQANKAGVYQKGRTFTNNRSHWNQVNGNSALWYDSRFFNVWTIGSLADLGSDIGGIFATQDTACPTTDNLYVYVTDAGEFIFAPFNSVSIQCVG